MSEQKEFDTLPDWLRELWSVNTSIARKAEKDISILEAQRDELRAERDRLLFHESQLVESLRSYMNKYGPGYSSTDTLAHDNALGVLTAILAAEPPEKK